MIVFMPHPADPQKIKEAQSHLNKGNSAVKQSRFHKPDWLVGAGAYLKAAELFSKEQQIPEAKNAFVQSAIAFDNAGLQAKSGEVYVQASKCAFQLGLPEEGVDLLMTAKTLYFEGGQVCAALQCLKEAAEKMKATEPQISLRLYDVLLEILESQNCYHWAPDSFVDYAILCYEIQDWEKCFPAWERAKRAFEARKYENGMVQCVTSAIAIHLSRGDVVAAKELFEMEMQEDYFRKSDYFEMIDYIVRGVRNRDGDLLELGQKHFTLQFLKPEISRIICGFKAPKRVTPNEEEKKGGTTPAPAALRLALDGERGEGEAHEEEEDEDRWLL
jgi:tetratricopeptide (TPR) repeat protein